MPYRASHPHRPETSAPTGAISGVRRPPRSGNLWRMKIVRTGRWLYDDSVEQPVDIVGLDVDFWYEIARADDALDPDESPTPLGTDGLLYYVRFRHAGEESTPTWVDSGGHPTVDGAVHEAEAKVPSPIRWS